MLIKYKIFIGWYVTSLVGKEQELVQEVEQYQLNVVGLNSTHSASSGTKLLESGWTLFFPEVPRVRCVGSSASLQSLGGNLEIWSYCQIRIE